jgi:lysozyme
MSGTSELASMLIRHEGLRLKPYRDTVGKLTVGCGRNLDDVGITQEEAMVLLNNDINTAELGLQKAFPWFDQLDPVRQDVLLDMVFNLGITRFMSFHRTIAAIEAQDWNKAADEMLQSRWAQQVGLRASELSQMMRTANYPQGG